MGSLDSAMANGRAWYEDICELIKRLDKATEQAADGDDQDCKAYDELRSEIEERPLSVMVRYGWCPPGESAHQQGPEEYEILLSTGGPGLRIWGRLSYGEPDDAELQAQDWGTPWTRVPDTEEKPVLAFARCFYFGE